MGNTEYSGTNNKLSEITYIEFQTEGKNYSVNVKDGYMYFEHNLELLNVINYFKDLISSVKDGGNLLMSGKDISKTNSIKLHMVSSKGRKTTYSLNINYNLCEEIIEFSDLVIFKTEHKISRKDGKSIITSKEYIASQVARDNALIIMDMLESESEKGIISVVARNSNSEMDELLKTVNKLFELKLITTTQFLNKANPNDVIICNVNYIDELPVKAVGKVLVSFSTHVNKNINRLLEGDPNIDETIKDATYRDLKEKGVETRLLTY